MRKSELKADSNEIIKNLINEQVSKETWESLSTKCSKDMFKTIRNR
jgi:hypothetical protein